MFFSLAILSLGEVSLSDVVDTDLYYGLISVRIKGLYSLLVHEEPPRPSLQPWNGAQLLGSCEVFEWPSGYSNTKNLWLQIVAERSLQELVEKCKWRI